MSHTKQVMEIVSTYKELRNKGKTKKKAIAITAILLNRKPIIIRSIIDLQEAFENQ